VLSHSPHERRGRGGPAPRDEGCALSAGPRPVIEQALLQLVCTDARHRGYLVHVCSWTPAAGAATEAGDLGEDVEAFPDVLLAHPVRRAPLWALTLRTSLRQPTPEQEAWMQALARSTSVEALLVRPGDYRELVERLGGRR
jgi:hypothetical protein